MGKINDCLKWGFIVFNLLFAIVGSLLVFVAVKNSTFAGFMVAGMIAMTIFGISMAFGRNQGTSGPNHFFAFAYGDGALLIIDFNMKTVMGVLFGFSVTAILGLLATTMLHQVRRHDDDDGGAAISTT